MTQKEEKGVRIGTVLTIATIIVFIMIAISGFTFKQSDTISRHDVRIDNLENTDKEAKLLRKEMREDLGIIKETLAELKTLLKNRIK